MSRVPGAVSTYRWQADIEIAAEVPLLIRTTRERFGALRARLVELHPDELPERIAVEAALGHPPYLALLAPSVAGDTP